MSVRSIKEGFWALAEVCALLSDSQAAVLAVLRLELKQNKTNKMFPCSSSAVISLQKPQKMMLLTCAELALEKSCFKVVCSITVTQ